MSEYYIKLEAFLFSFLFSSLAFYLPGDYKSGWMLGVVCDYLDVEWEEGRFLL